MDRRKRCPKKSFLGDDGELQSLLPNGTLQKYHLGMQGVWDMQGEFDFDKYPHKAGHRGVKTSKQSADDINPKLSRLKKMILIELDNVFPEGLTGSELSKITKKNIINII